ncbi:hypothetical protein CR513_59340, partial [Mucuna pruriens]
MLTHEGASDVKRANLNTLIYEYIRLWQPKVIWRLKDHGPCYIIWKTPIIFKKEEPSFAPTCFECEKPRHFKIDCPTHQKNLDEFGLEVKD